MKSLSDPQRNIPAAQLLPFLQSEFPKENKTSDSLDRKKYNFFCFTLIFSPPCAAASWSSRPSDVVVLFSFSFLLLFLLRLVPRSLVLLPLFLNSNSPLTLFLTTGISLPRLIPPSHWSSSPSLITSHSFLLFSPLLSFSPTLLFIPYTFFLSASVSVDPRGLVGHVGV